MKTTFNYGKLFLFLILPLSVFLSFNKHSKDRYNTYHSVIWADAAGYYVYLPMIFIYDNVKQYPDSIIEKCGNGFSLDATTNLVRTKYPSGVSILEFPFFIISHLLANSVGQEANGFSKIYQWGIMIAAVVYSCIGMYLLCIYLSGFYSRLFSFLIVLALYLSTNLYYYSIDATGMSHAYSFVLFAAFILVTKKIFESLTVSRLLLLSSLFALIVLVRPTNGIIFLFFLFYNVKNKTDWKTRVLFFKQHIKFLPLALLVMLMFFIPQFVYWKSISGNWIYYSYPGESFVFWNQPKLLMEWFSTNNGFFIYAPVMLVSVMGMFRMIRRKENNGWLIFALFILGSYLFASWWNWWFGCSYGARSFIDFYPLLIIPFAYFINSVKNKSGKIFLWSFIVLCIAINMNIIYYYDGCFYGGEWDWSEYWKLHLK